MAASGNRKLVIKCRETDAYNLSTVVGDPRAARPLDVKAACNNLAIECDGKRPPRDVMSLIGFVITGYFDFAHRTGLYNRQKELWDSIARISFAKIEVVKAGLIIPVKMPVFDIEFSNAQNETIILARLVKRQKRKDFDGRCLRYLKSFVAKVNKRKAKQASLTGAFFCVPSPVPQIVLERMFAMTGGKDDPINRYESRLPPYGAIMNIVDMVYPDGMVSGSFDREGEPLPAGSGDYAWLYPEAELLEASLVHPQLKGKS